MRDNAQYDGRHPLYCRRQTSVAIYENFRYTATGVGQRQICFDDAINLADPENPL